MTAESMARSCLSNTRPHSRGARRPRFGRAFVPQKTEGAGKAGCPMHPQPRVQNLSEAHERSHRGFAGTPGLPCAMVLTASFVLSPAIGLVCHRHLRIGGEFGPVEPALASANLTPASGRQDHTTSPSATCVVRLRAVNRSRAQRTALRPRLRADAAASTASRPASVTIASRSSGGETDGLIELILARAEVGYFSNRGWTGFADLPDGQFADKGLWPSSAISLHPQSPTVDFIADPLTEVARQNWQGVTPSSVLNAFGDRALPLWRNRV
jgi:hypothetical protein